jgi:hypothetical protein
MLSMLSCIPNQFWLARPLIQFVPIPWGSLRNLPHL